MKFLENLTVVSKRMSGRRDARTHGHDKPIFSLIKVGNKTYFALRPYVSEKQHPCCSRDKYMHFHILTETIIKCGIIKHYEPSKNFQTKAF
jgi:hypothetical protein